MKKTLHKKGLSGAHFQEELLSCSAACIQTLSIPNFYHTHYNSYGFLSNVNLITTFESKDHPLDVTYVESLVNHFSYRKPEYVPAQLLALL